MTELARGATSSDGMFKTRPDESAYATATLSAIGSVPQHLMALVVALAINDGLVSVEHASWISTSYVCGMLAGTIGLPLAGVARIPRTAAGAALLTLALAGLAAMPGTIPLGPMDMLAWGLMGAGSAGLNVLGSLYAASQSDGRRFLQLRLGAVLLGSALVLAAAHAIGLFSAYADAVKVLVAIPLLGILLIPRYCPPEAGHRVAVTSMRACGAAPLGLFALALFFVGQPGFTAYAAHIAGQNGLSVVELPLIYAAGKGVASFVLLLRRVAQLQPSQPWRSPCFSPSRCAASHMRRAKRGSLWRF